MKWSVFLAVFSLLCFTVQSRILPKSFPEFCARSNPNYSECMKNVLKNFGGILANGVREINFPKLNPLYIPSFVINRTLGDLVSIDAVLKNIYFWGLDKTGLQNFKLDTETLSGEMTLFLPNLNARFEYDVQGKLLGNVIDHGGFFKGDFKQLGLKIKFTLKPVDKLGVKYYTFEDFQVFGTIEDGLIKLVAKRPEDQAIADLLLNQYNANFKLFTSAVQPIYDESLRVFYKTLAEQVFSNIPAKELLPE